MTHARLAAILAGVILAAAMTVAAVSTLGWLAPAGIGGAALAALALALAVRLVSAARAWGRR